jgi:exodeoxyribonuclease-5
VRFFAKQFNPDGPISNCSVVIVDEVSMVNEQLGLDLLRYKKPILVIGDPGQLPPPKGCGFFTNRAPDLFLTEIHRQAKGSPIIEMATAVRSGRSLAYGAYGNSAVERQISPRRMLDFDMIIVGTHRTRQAVNAQYRHTLGFTEPLPAVGERLLCLRNSLDGKPLFNGTVWTVVGATPMPDDGFIDLTVADDDGLRVDVKAPIQLLLEDDHNGADAPGNPFTWGYALTCHKAQGSQWNQVLVIDESEYFGTDRWRWLYTAITRAADNVLVTRGVAP